MDFLLIFNSLLLGVGLAMDAFSVSLANGLSDPCMKRRKIILIAMTFALFQGFMPFIGWVFVHTLAEVFSVFQMFIPWIALGLLSFIGGKMLFDGVGEMREKKDCDNACPCIEKKLGVAALLVQGVATSIDALSVGFTIAEYNIIEALISASVIALTTFVICFAGVMIGKKFGTALAGKSAIFGGAILIVIGLEIFITSFV